LGIRGGGAENGVEAYQEALAEDEGPFLQEVEMRKNSPEVLLFHGRNSNCTCFDGRG